MPAQRILIIKHGALGDVVLAMGTMKRLRELHPEAHITLMTMGMFVPMAEPYDKPSSVDFQLECLKNAGFDHVGIPYKYYVFAVFWAKK